MNLLLLRNDPYNDILRQLDGTPLYRFQTPYPESEEKDTLISKFQMGEAKPVGSIKRPSYDSDSVSVGKQDLYLSTHTNFNRYGTFCASDGKLYKWKKKDKKLKLIDGSKEQIAEYNESPQLISETEFAEGSITVEPSGYPIIDEIIVSFAFAEAKRREKKEAKSSLLDQVLDVFSEVGNVISN